MSQIQTKFLADNAVTNAKLAQMAADTLKGNNTGSPSDPLDLSVSDVQTMLSIPTPSSPLSLAAGGTGISAATANDAFNALSPMTTDGDLITGGASGSAMRLGIGTEGQVLTVVSGAVAWADDTETAMTIGTINSQAASANGLVIAANVLYAQYAAATTPGMVSIATSATALSNSSGAIAVKVDASTIHINGSNNLSSLQPAEERITLGSLDIVNQYVDLAHPIFGSSASANSAQVFIAGGPQQLKTVDYTVSLTGGTAGVTRLTFAGDLATGGSAELVSGDIFVADYSFLA